MLIFLHYFYDMIVPSIIFYYYEKFSPSTSLLQMEELEVHSHFKITRGRH